MEHEIHDPPSPVVQFRLVEADIDPDEIAVRARIVMEDEDAVYMGTVEGTGYVAVASMAAAYALEWRCWLSRIVFEDKF